ncbi:Stk1 family PASTA domain-containing Ser/Thr kinase [Leucobacter sp. OH1287]|uniref:Stk1 family PASTA domain-containing Ser/Thr kinase n=1 Tax=Leucobacter sp. OH1287 TaxID=2491049 RepID=UPI000F5F093E|nr:Stk1 family PASTA domain-containing Ser/Thr kinase [Leucobacter sp. OH1287]RRD60332.1 Stk1 family PASTA domain-containing Ser/Thr kinase [Leucobacter sp. OH1287]
MTETEETTETRSGRILAGRYTVKEFIGQGGMATVYKGVDTKLGRTVAIKIMKADLAGDEAFIERFRQEAQSAARMSHQSIVRVLDAGDDYIQTAAGAKKIPFIVMEYVDGKNLRQYLASGEVSLDEAARITYDVLDALEYSHRAGIVHRDIKPANIMVTSKGRVKVMDFGIARAVSETSSTLQQTTTILGTAAYFSPEQAKGETVDSRSDLYSTGVMLYEMVAGKVPFRGDSAVAVAYQHVSERPVAPSKVNERVTAPFDRVILHALAKDRNRRFQTAGEFREALRLAAAGQMPDLAGGADEDTSLLDGGSAQESEMALQQLADTTPARNQSRPPVLWIWAAVVTIVAMVAAVAFWALNFAGREVVPANSRLVPDVVGVEKEMAIDMLEDLDLIVVPIQEASDEIEEGKAIRTDPAAGTTLVKGDTVTLFISAGSESVAVPNIVGMTQADAAAALAAVGLKIGQITEADDPTVGAGIILSSDPETGKELTKGSSVKVQVASGMVTIPDVKGQSLQAARNLLGSLGLIVTPVPRACEVTDPSLPIVEQSLVGKQPQGSEVNIVYCTGVEPTAVPTPPPAEED